MSEKKTAVIIGAGPAGLTAAYELLTRTRIVPIVLEASPYIGGISRTHVHNGNRIDLGGHRFFSKSDRVMDWWQKFLPIQADADQSIEIKYHNAQSCVKPAGVTTAADDYLMVRPRVSRILYGGQLFDYPLSFSAATVKKLGYWNTLRAGIGYIFAQIFPRNPEENLEDFLINRFGRYLYRSFFEEYTQKVWGVPCREIPADWGRQRIKGVSIVALLKHAVKQQFSKSRSVRQKDTETSLIEQFLYPKYGPGQMWERVADEIRALGGDIRLNEKVDRIETSDGKISSVSSANHTSGEHTRFECDLAFSTMPVRDLFAALDPGVDKSVAPVADGLVYRDFMTVGLLLPKLSLGDGVTATQLRSKLPDNWIYIQEPGVRVGRLQIFNNWSEHLVADPANIWVGLEYFLNDTDDLWAADDRNIVGFACEEMKKIGFMSDEEILDSVVIRQPKAYPAYFGTYGRFGEAQDYLEKYANLYPLGRNGQHRYNNQDHSILTAMLAVDHIATGSPDKSEIWNVNTEEDYHETHGEAES